MTLINAKVLKHSTELTARYISENDRKEHWTNSAHGVVYTCRMCF